MHFIQATALLTGRPVSGDLALSAGPDAPVVDQPTRQPLHRRLLAALPSRRRPTHRTPAVEMAR